MAATASVILRHLRRLVQPQAESLSSDVELLERFRRDRDDRAFADLVKRHGPMVWHVCRRVLPNSHTAEDAFQAVWLVLATRTSSLRRPQSLAAFLHGIAHRVAMKARAKQIRDHVRESGSPTAGPVDPRPDPLTELTVRELITTVDEEVERLPDVCRLPVILCYLEGRTQDEAARILGWSVGSVKGRLERGRAKLHARLVRRGLTLPAVLAVMAATKGGSAASVPAVLFAACVQNAVAVGSRTSGAISRQAAVLADANLRALAMTNLKVSLALWISIGAAGLLGSALVCRMLLAQAGETPTLTAQVSASSPQQRTPIEKPQRRMDLFGDPLPSQALARLGTARLHHGGIAWSCAFSPNGKQIVSVGSDRTIRIWEVTTGREVRRLPGDEFDRRAFFFADGKTIAYAYFIDSEIHVWDTATGQEIRRIKPRPWVRLLGAPDEKTLVYECGRGVIEAWDMAAGVQLYRTTLRGDVHAIVLSPDGKTVAAAYDDRTVRLYEAMTGREVRRIASGGEPGASAELKFSPNGRRLALIGPEQSIHILDIGAQKAIRLLKGKYAHVAFSSANDVLASVSSDRTVGLWNLVTGQEVGKYQSEYAISCIDFSPDGTVLGATDFSGRIILLYGATARELPFSAQSSGGATHALFHPDGKELVSWGNSMQVLHHGDRRLRFWNATTGKERPLAAGYPEAVYSLACAPDGQVLMVNTWDGKVSILDGTTGRQVREIPGKYRPVWSTPPAHTLLTLADAGKSPTREAETFIVHGWQLQPGRQIVQFHGQPDLPYAGRVGVSPDGKMLATQGSGSAGSSIIIWDQVTGKELWRVPGISSWTTFIFAPDSRTLALTGILANGGAHREDDEVQIRDSASGRLVQTFGRQVQRFTTLAFSRDGRTLATGSKDGTVRLWETASGGSRATFTGHAGRVNTLDFSPDENRLVSGADDNTALVWELNDGDARTPFSVKLETHELNIAWNMLAGSDARPAFQAVRKLARNPGQAVPLIGKHLRPAAVPNHKWIEGLIGDLGRDEFAVREKAADELTKLGDSAVSAVRDALQKKPLPEVERRLTDLIEKLHGWPATRLQERRALEVLERIGTPEAQRLLRAVATGDPDARLTREAQTALSRLQSSAAPR